LDGKTSLTILHLQDSQAGTDVSHAEQLLREAANSGYAFAAMQLGHLYTSDKTSADQNATDAIDWYKKAADGGIAEAQHILGVLHLDGRGVAKDPQQAASWLSRAADGNHPLSQFQLAVMHCTGNGVPKDLGRAVVWYEAAARQGHRLAQFNLAAMLTSGQGCEPDAQKAFSWFKKAADQGMTEAQLALGDIYVVGRGIPRDDGAACHVDRVRRSDQEERMAVRRCLHDRLSANIAGGARPVLDDELLAEPLGEPLPHQARDGVDAAPGGKAEHDAHRPRWTSPQGL
jgi:uncharacterized protein